MPYQNKLAELNEALKLFNISQRGWAKTLVNPNTGEKGVSHTAVSLVAKGKNETEWIKDKIESKIQEAHDKFPGYYADKKKMRGSYAL